MKHIAVFLVSIINILITVRYCWLTKTQKIKPSLAMWVFFTIAVALSLATYLRSGGFYLWDNILNSTDVILVVCVSIAILIFGDKSTKFTAFDKGCLIAVLIITAFWVCTQHHLAANLMVQIITTIAYFPVVKRLWESKNNTESFTAWIGMLLASAISLFSNRGLLASIYSIRAIVSIFLLLLLMLRIELVKKKAVCKQPARRRAK
ncbi:MAG: hypothetical protein JW822_12110 [Spirochaetales bacterium]|nr:hypothetical protein [Spirochaetales bacterium]